MDPVEVKIFNYKFIVMLKICPICKGSGEVDVTDIIADRCYNCNGTGRISVKQFKPVEQPKPLPEVKLFAVHSTDTWVSRRGPLFIGIADSLDAAIDLIERNCIATSSDPLTDIEKELLREQHITKSRWFDFEITEFGLNNLAPFKAY